MPGPLELATDWRLDPVLSAALLANLFAYLLAVRRIRRRGSRWPGRRTAAFCAGLATLAVALESGLEPGAAELLSLHMVQHLLLTLVAPPLLLLGAPVSLALRALPRGSRRPLARLVTSPAARAIAHPAVCWSAFAAVTLSTHLTPFYDAAVRDPALHGLEHVLYVGAGLLLWLPVVGADPAPRSSQPALRILYLLLAMPPMILVGVVLAGSSSMLYPSYLEPAAALGVSALGDQHAAGMIMWVWGSVTFAFAAIAVGWSALVLEERRQAAKDASLGGIARGSAAIPKRSIR